MKLSNKEVIEEFYEKIKEDYPELTFKQVKDLCHSPWFYAHREIASDNLPDVRLKYFGVFRVYEGRARDMLPTIERRREEGILSKEKYEELKAMITKFLRRKDENS